jgi:pimeloyl-ACP methyl ester carboxylesterase
MPHVVTNGIRIAYERLGQGPCVLFIAGSGAAGRVWNVHQTPALNDAGYQTITMDNRGIPPSDVPPGRYTLAEVVSDARAVIEALELAPCRIVGASMGAIVAQELALARPDLVRCAVLIATRARSDAIRRAQTAGDRARITSGVELPPSYRAAVTAQEMLSPSTLNDDQAVSTWLDVFELAGGRSAGSHGQAWIDLDEDRREALGKLAVACRVIAFDDDLVCPPHLAAEVADAIPDCDFVKISDCGHLGHLERPDEVNAAVIEFLDRN